MIESPVLAPRRRSPVVSQDSADVLSSAAQAQLDRVGPEVTHASAAETAIEVSVIMPCLNEAETLEVCINKARRCLEKNNIRGEVIVADNGSTDGSVEIARRAGARVVHVAEKGYGAALRGGFGSARGKYLIMGDADDSYDFENFMPFIERLRAGDDLVMGNRFRGGIGKGAMPWHHKYIGNPVLTGILNLFFRSGIGDAHCGLRGLSRRAFVALDLKTPGMEFASEMVIKAVMQGMRISEVPTTLKPAGRSRPPHLRSFRDGWRHLRFMMLLAPNWLLMLPGAVMALLGGLIFLLLMRGPIAVGPAVLDVHTMLIGALGVTLGYQAITMGYAARIYAVLEGIARPSRALEFGFRVINLERGLLAGAAMAACGLAIIVAVTLIWANGSFGPLDTSRTLRPLAAGITLITLGMQTVLMSFFYSMLGLCGRRG
ncbi:MAG TPA: glycosyltransferase family 2 protein [Phycisphaerae bacterium]|nr:glycosyltransferase family 2 protein [Phycisphaerae bacterium]HOJ72338.1 glycosyltransferase family 2 protein [Phycisphaerae bacterium]HOM50000.1 glycosyltransferase family 2 protein [Phycisphaerae bacterium]HON65832.1 glycosyltransferase family 2 protein [Phycisphaerae bacterium]HOQ84752.1 glycosyltransferase family 2 protein [Phycisphaerae bacterium]